MITEQSAHTSTPWQAELDHVVARNVDGNLRYEHSIAICPGPDGEANARRIAACANACTEIATEELESGVINEMIEALGTVLQYWDGRMPEDDAIEQWVESVYLRARPKPSRPTIEQAKQGEASSTATNHDEEYEEWLRRAEEERYYNEYGREA